jgi:type IV secretory pathway VirB10-like protein
MKLNTEKAEELDSLDNRNLWGKALLTVAFAIILIGYFMYDKDDDTPTQAAESLPPEEVYHLPEGQAYHTEQMQTELPLIKEVIAATPLEKPVSISPNLGRLTSPSVIIKPNASAATTSSTTTASGSIYGNNEDSAFINEASLGNTQVLTSTANVNDDLAYKMFQGKHFPAVLTQAINSDLPGMVVAEISQPVYGFQERIALFPAGTRLVGTYNSQVMLGGKRLGIIWLRAIRPDGIDIIIDSPGSDRLGQAGLTGFVDNYFWETFGTSAMLSIMAVGASNIDGEGEYSNQYQQASVASMIDTSDDILEKRLNRKPTIYINQGEIINITLAKDLDFSAALAKTAGIQVF